MTLIEALARLIYGSPRGYQPLASDKSKGAPPKGAAAGHNR